MKTVTISVRVSQEDAQFIAGLEVAGASTPSDKLRSIIADARQRHEGVRDFIQAVRAAEQLIASGRHRVRDLEHRHRVHSDLVALVADWLPEATATLMTDGEADARDHAAGPLDVRPASHGDEGRENAEDADGERRSLAQLERRLADQLFRLIEATLRLGVTQHCRCYDGKVVAQRLGPTLEIARLIDAASQSKEASP